MCIEHCKAVVEGEFTKLRIEPIKRLFVTGGNPAGVGLE